MRAVSSYRMPHSYHDGRAKAAHDAYLVSRQAERGALFLRGDSLVQAAAFGDERALAP